MLRVEDVLQYNDLDNRIWNEELDAFVPQRIYDLHTHLTHADFDRGTKDRYDALGGVFELCYHADMSMLDHVDSLLMPGRSVERLVFPIPHKRCDFEGSNQYVAANVADRPDSAALMLVHPGMAAADVDRAIRKHRFLGFKPYRWYSVTGDPKNCRIADFMPEHILEVGNRYGLIVGLHLSKQDAIADDDNLADLERLSQRFPRLRWGLFHCARSYSDWPLEKAAPRLKQIPNLWYEGSSVCETDAFDVLFETADRGRVCYGSDDLPVGAARGKYVAYGRAWVSVHEQNQTFNVDHCDGRMTFTRYEMLRAMRRAARHARFTRQEIEDLFYNNAMRLIQETRSDLESVLGP